MKKKLALIIVLILITALIATACQQDNSDTLEGQLLKKGKIVAGTSPDYPPFESIDENGNLIGFDIDLMKAIAKEMDLEIEFVEMNFDVIISTLQGGQIDVGLAAFTYDAERDVLFSTPYLISGQAVVVAADSDIATLEDLVGKRIITGLGTTGEEASKEIVDAEIIFPDDYLIGFEMLKNGQGDALVCDLAVAKNYAQLDEFKMLENTLTEENMSIIVKKGNDKLMEAIDAAITVYMATDSYQEIVTELEASEE